jgi:hypothetical protein
MTSQYLTRAESGLRVNVFDAEHGWLIASRVFLWDSISEQDDEYALAEQAIATCGQYYIGGGAAPLFLLTKAG